MKVLAILNDSAVLNKMKTVLFPEKLSNEIRHLRETILSFQKKLDEISQHIIMLETKVSRLECKLDEIEQYGRRSNLIFSGFAELPQGEDLEGKLLDIANHVTYMSTQRDFLEGQTRSHRAKRANFGWGVGGGGSPSENFKNLHCKWCNLRYS